ARLRSVAPPPRTDAGRSTLTCHRLSLANSARCANRARAALRAAITLAQLRARSARRPWPKLSFSRMKKSRAHFPRIKPIAYEGPGAANPLAFRHYNPDEMIDGKT